MVPLGAISSGDSQWHPRPRDKAFRRPLTIIDHYKLVIVVDDSARGKGFRMEGILSESKSSVSLCLLAGWVMSGLVICRRHIHPGFLRLHELCNLDGGQTRPIWGRLVRIHALGLGRAGEECCEECGPAASREAARSVVSRRFAMLGEVVGGKVGSGRCR